MYKLALELAKLKKLGVSVSVKLREPQEKDKAKILALSNIEPGSDGLILQEENEKQTAFAVVVNCLGRNDLKVVLTHGSHGEVVESMKPQSDWTHDVVSVDTYIRLVGTRLVMGGYSTTWDANSLRIVSTRGGRLQIFSVAIVTRLYDEKKGAYHFLVVQEMYNAKLYRDPLTSGIMVKERIVTSESEYAGFNRWTAMKGLVEEMISSQEKAKLPSLGKAIASAVVIDRIFQKGRGRVVFFDVNKGFGFADTAEGATFFHWKGTETEDRLPYFFSGQKISFDSIKESQLVGVRPA